MIEQLRTIKPPETGLWRVGRRQEPLPFHLPEPPDLTSATYPRNRFDDLLGRTPTIYFSSTVEAAIAETAMPLRTKPSLEALLPGDDTIGPNRVSAAYREKRLIVRAE